MSPADSVTESLPPKIAVTKEQLAAFNTRSEFSGLAHELYKEATGVVLVCAGARASEAALLNRDHAILVGMLIRIYKFMRSIAILTAGSPQSREAVYALNRCVVETVINLYYLMLKDDPALFDDFVAKSLGPEKEIMEEINANVAKNGGTPTAMEDRMLVSIARVFKESGVDPTNVPIKHQDWAENIRMRLKALNWLQAYPFLYREGSHAIHGTWVDILMNNLHCVGPDQFDIDPDCGMVDSRLLSPMARITLDVSKEYLSHLSQKMQGCEPIFERVEDLHERTELVSVAYEEFLQKPDDD